MLPATQKKDKVYPEFIEGSNFEDYFIRTKIIEFSLS